MALGFCQTQGQILRNWQGDLWSPQTMGRGCRWPELPVSQSDKGMVLKAGRSGSREWGEGMEISLGGGLWMEVGRHRSWRDSVSPRMRWSESRTYRLTSVRSYVWLHRGDLVPLCRCLLPCIVSGPRKQFRSGHLYPSYGGISIEFSR